MGRRVVFVFAAFCTVALDRLARLRWIVLVGLSVVVRPGTAQELDLRPLPLPQGEFLTSPSTASPPSSDAEEKEDPRPKSAHKGRSKRHLQRSNSLDAYSRTEVQGHCTGTV